LKLFYRLCHGHIVALLGFDEVAKRGVFSVYVGAEDEPNKYGDWLNYQVKTVAVARHTIWIRWTDWLIMSENTGRLKYSVWNNVEEVAS